MTTLTAADIAAVAKGAGFTGQGLVKAIAVAQAESSGRAEVVNAIGCVGLWQINQPVHVRSHPTWTRAWLQVPANNAAAAYALSNHGASWLPWEAYTTGAYAKYLPGAQVAAGNPSAANASWSLPIPLPNGGTWNLPIPGTPDQSINPDGTINPNGPLAPVAPLANTGAALDSIAKTAAVLGSVTVHAATWLGNPSNWTRVAFVVAGGGACLAGLVLLSNSGVGGPAGAVADAGAKVAHGAKAGAKVAATAALL